MRVRSGQLTALSLTLLFVCAVVAPSLADATADLSTGQDLMKAGNYDGAIALFSSVVASGDPALAPKGQLCIGIALQGKKSYPESIAALKLGIQTYPNADRARSEMLFRLGEVHGISGDTASAIEVYQSIAVQYPADAAKANLCLANVFFKEMKYAEAIDLLKKNISAQPDAGSSLYDLNTLLGRCYRESGDLQNAVDTYKKLATLFPEKADRAYLEMGICLQLQERYPDARAAFQNALDVGNGVSNEARLRIDEVFRAEKKYAEELEYLQTMYDEVPELRAQSLTRQAEVMSECLGGISQAKDAIEKLRQAIREFPEDPLAVEAQARIAKIQLYNLRDFAAAETGLREFMAKYPDDPSLIVIAHDLAFCLYLQKNHALAADLYVKASRMKEVGNYVAVCMYMAADSYMRAGDYLNAKVLADLLMSTYPNESWSRLADINYSNLTIPEKSGGLK